MTMARASEADGVLSLDADEARKDPDADEVSTARNAHDPADVGPTWLGGVGVLTVTAVLVVFGSLQGLLAAVVVAGGWFLLANTYAFALGQVALVSALPGDPVAFAVAQAGLLAVLFGPLAEGVGPWVADDRGRDAAESRELAALTAVGLLAGGVAAWVGQQSPVGLPVTGLLLVGGLALAAYGLHRYQLVALGLVGEPEADDDSAGPEPGDDTSGPGPGNDSAGPESGDDSRHGGDADEQ